MKEPTYFIIIVFETKEHMDFCGCWGISDQWFQIGNQACQITIIAVWEGWTFLSDLLLFFSLWFRGELWNLELQKQENTYLWKATWHPVTLWEKASFTWTKKIQFRPRGMPCLPFLILMRNHVFNISQWLPLDQCDYLIDHTHGCHFSVYIFSIWKQKDNCF